jgi:hypothetical protein
MTTTRLGRNPFASEPSSRKAGPKERPEERRSRALESRFCLPVRVASTAAATAYVLGMKAMLLAEEVFASRG